jgi:proteasome lid subunit RPN8/RPN11
MSIRIARAAMTTIRGDCAARAPQEACGLLLGVRERVDRALPAANIAAEPERRFEIDPITLFAAHRAARAGAPAIVGCYHSHPRCSADPSATDAAQAFDDDWIWLIVGADAEKAYRVVRAGPIMARFEILRWIED